MADFLAKQNKPADKSTEPFSLVSDEQETVITYLVSDIENGLGENLLRIARALEKVPAHRRDRAAAALRMRAAYEELLRRPF